MLDKILAIRKTEYNNFIIVKIAQTFIDVF